ncbi:MAG: peptidoglycan synthetase [Flavobacteriales bacterium]|nr:peptidoglycan synthetase [Flavobacteriales bacterium]NNK80261.1 peptidoglycan synthetase [Flavobacteriales bacterium]
MRVHFIAIGGAAMHNLAIALNRKAGYEITGSDDKIFDPSKSRLEREGILPDDLGWHEERMTTDLDAVILGMHAREDNPELARAKELGLKIYSYPEYLYEQSKNKKRVVIGGSHGKTSITAMILHVLQDQNVDCDYMVGAQLDGFDCMVRLSDAPIIILEGDEYLSSPIDRRPKFHLYKPHIAVLSGIAWDHINVFPTFENYVSQFTQFVRTIEDRGELFYYCGDTELKSVCEPEDGRLSVRPYATHDHMIEGGTTYLINKEKRHSLEVFGRHNLQNISAALSVCKALGLESSQFYKSITKFKGAARRLELVKKNQNTVFYKDFAHSPSKLKATTEALKEQYPDRELIACMELHTFSSLNKDFLHEYKGSMEKADQALVYYDPLVVEQKRLEPITSNDIEKAFGTDNVKAYDKASTIVAQLKAMEWPGKNLLLMTSGNFNGLDIPELADVLIP